jgi:hypothetical protein
VFFEKYVNTTHLRLILKVAKKQFLVQQQRQQMQVLHG